MSTNLPQHHWTALRPDPCINLWSYLATTSSVHKNQHYRKVRKLTVTSSLNLKAAAITRRPCRNMKRYIQVRFIGMLNLKDSKCYTSSTLRSYRGPLLSCRLCYVEPHISTYLLLCHNSGLRTILEPYPGGIWLVIITFLFVKFASFNCSSSQFICFIALSWK